MPYKSRDGDSKPTYTRPRISILYNVPSVRIKKKLVDFFFFFFSLPRNTRPRLIIDPLLLLSPWEKKEEEEYGDASSVVRASRDSLNEDCPNENGSFPSEEFIHLPQGEGEFRRNGMARL